MRILTLDIETRPNLAHVWGIWQQNIGLNQLLEPVEVISFAAKWHDTSHVVFKSVFHDGRAHMLEVMWELLNDADAVVHYNGKHFDIPHLNREFVTHGFGPPSPYKQIDMLEVVKRVFKFPSNKLAYVVVALGVGHKMKNEGHELWIKCMAGDEAAWKKMRAYNIRDVRVTEKLYDFLLPWIQGHPTTLDVIGGLHGCPRCGGEVIKQGHAYTKVGKFQRYQCTACGSWSRDVKRITGATITDAA